MSSTTRGLQLLRKYRFVIINAVFSGIVGTAVTSVWNTVAPSAAIDQLQLALLVAVALFVAIFAFDIKRSVVSRLDVIEGTVGRIAGRRRRRQYDERRTHHAEEKSLLTEELVVKQLPSLIAGSAFANRDEIAIIVDSGTTLEGVPARLRSSGLGRGPDDPQLSKLRLFTNSVSGGEEFSNESQGFLKDDQLLLFPGSPIEKYRAVIGQATVDAVWKVSEDCKKSGNPLVGLVTANWCLVGRGYDRLVLCSTEKAHLDFKKAVAECADYLFIVSPLGKLLCTDSAEDLNRALEGERPVYDGFDVFEHPRTAGRTYLLTTCRERKDSVLLLHCQNLKDAKGRPRPFGLIDFGYDPAGSRDEQIKIEVPHEYMRKHLRLLQIA